jgi:hypothetical protein
MKTNKQTKKQRTDKSVRLIRGGGCAAPDVVSQYISPMCHTMTKGFEGSSNIFQKVFEGPGPGTSELGEQYNLQYGGGSGLTVDFDNLIEKTPTYLRYDDQAPPVLLNGKMHFSNCDYNQCGGKISLYKVKKMSNKRPTKKSNSKSKSKRMTQRKSHSKKNMKLRSKSKPRINAKKSKKSKKTKKSKKQYGGEAPVNFSPDLMNMGGSVNEPSMFSPDMSTRDFGCNQPNWSPKCI